MLIGLVSKGAITSDTLIGKNKSTKSFTNLHTIHQLMKIWKPDFTPSYFRIIFSNYLKIQNFQILNIDVQLVQLLYTGPTSYNDLTSYTSPFLYWVLLS